MAWRELIGAAFTDAKFYIPASAKEIGHAEQELGVEFPGELRELLLETNGASANYSAPLIWPLDEIVAQNRHFRTSADFAKLYQPFSDLLFFGAEGNGDQFAYRDTSIYKWDHETDERTLFASDLKDYVNRQASSIVQPERPRRSFLSGLAAKLFGRAL